MINILTSLIAPVANFFTSRNETKAKADAAKASITKARIDGETQHTLNIDEWGSAQQTVGGWYMEGRVCDHCHYITVRVVVCGVDGECFHR